MVSVYIMRNGSEPLFKVGISVDPERRRRQLQTGNPRRVKLLWSVEVPDAQKTEGVLHAYLRERGCAIRGEWFELQDDVVVMLARQLLRHKKLGADVH
jgi:hypothetical protein